MDQFHHSNWHILNLKYDEVKGHVGIQTSILQLQMPGNRYQRNTDNLRFLPE